MYMALAVAARCGVGRGDCWRHDSGALYPTVAKGGGGAPRQGSWLEEGGLGSRSSYDRDIDEYFVTLFH